MNIPDLKYKLTFDKRNGKLMGRINKINIKLFSEKDIIATLWKCGCPTTYITEFKKFGERLLSDKQFREMYYSSKKEEIKSYRETLDETKIFTMKQIYDTIAVAFWGHGTGIDWHIKYVRGLRKNKFFVWGNKELKTIYVPFDKDGYATWTLGKNTKIEFIPDENYKVKRSGILKTLPK